MSEAMFAGLPRFDDGAARTPGSWKRSLEEDAPASRPAIAPTVQSREEAAAPSQAAEPAPPQRPADLTQLEASLKSISARLDKIERDAQTQSRQALQSMAAKLFPELSQRFLAEEISRSLPKLVPASAAVIEIRAGEKLAADLQDLIARTPSLENRCSVLPSDSEASGKADISWQTGGLSFDFDALLATLLAQLNPSQPMTRE